ncbi:MAG: bifunctional nuclease family protein [Bacteroidetes bacterium]|nr:bifunctional nuclease family protein [Bacteroidota bacterium]
MKKIELAMSGLAAASSSLSSGYSYVVILKEKEGNRTLPITITTLEAQAFVAALEKTTSDRPMTHELIKRIIYSTSLVVKEVLICDFKNDIFYARLVLKDEIDNKIIIDCRPSDAIVIALYCEAPIFVNEDILDDIGVTSRINKVDSCIDGTFPFKEMNDDSKYLKIEMLKRKLDNAVRNEEYERAAEIKTELDSLNQPNK